MPPKKCPNKHQGKQKPKGAKSTVSRGNYQKLINRLYEPLLLLSVLDPVRRDHTTASVPEDASALTQRQFQDDLAFLCEYDKGGDACTALAIEERETCHVYWVAANTDPKKNIAPFLGSVLEFLAGTLHDSTTNTAGAAHADSEAAENTENLTAMAVLFALPKIKKLYRLLCAAIRNTDHCLQHGAFSEQERELASWLRQFTQWPSNLAGDVNKGQENGLTLCRLAYTERLSSEMRQLKALTAIAGSDDCFAKAHHYIGRLAHHVRVPARLVQAVAVSGLDELLCNPYRVQSVPVAPSVPFQLPRSIDEHGHASLEDIAHRMSNSADADLRLELTTSLCELDRQYGAGQRYCQAATDLLERQPRVHAEVQVLEHFHSQMLSWAGNGGRFIGCSKPACFCCHLYFQHHPLRPVVPSSHGKLYLKWGPPLLAGGVEDAGYIKQRDILNRVIADVRKDVVEHIRSQRTRKQWHADSLTAITHVIANGLGGDTNSIDYDDTFEDTEQCFGGATDATGATVIGTACSSGSACSGFKEKDVIVEMVKQLAVEDMASSSTDSDSDNGGVCL